MSVEFTTLNTLKVNKLTGNDTSKVLSLLVYDNVAAIYTLNRKEQKAAFLKQE